MQLYRTVDNDNIVRLEEDGGAAVTFKAMPDRAVILSLFVPKFDREEGIGTALLEAVEKECADRGIPIIESDFYGGIKGMKELFEARGFELEDTASVYSVDMKELLRSDKTKKVVKKNLHSVRFLSLEELSMDQWDELISLMAKFDVPIAPSALNIYSQYMSGLVYDSNNVAQSMILCTENDDSVHIDLLLTSGKNSKNNMSLTIAALQGMLIEIISAGGYQKYPTMTMICVNDSVKRLMDSVLEDYEPREIGRAVYASKRPSPEEVENVEIEEYIDEDNAAEWHREIKKVSVQQNIGWKIALYRRKSQAAEKKITDAKEAPPEESASAVEPVQQEKETVELYSRNPDFPYELSDPFDIKYGVEKDEDEIAGLMYDDTIRITIDNVDDYISVLPPDAVQNLPRPYYRGLTFEQENSRDWIIYELKDVDAEVGAKSEIQWMNFSDEDRGKKLLSEYQNELKDADAGSSSFETENEDTKSRILKEMGFEVTEKESRDIWLTVGEFGNLPLIGRKIPEYVLALNEISERQFKRGIGYCMINNRKGLLEDLAFLPMEWFEQDVSSVVLTDGRVSGMLLIHQLASARLMVDLWFSSSGDSQLDLLRMMGHSIQAAVKKYPADTSVLLRRHNKTVAGITGRLFPDKKGETVLHGKRKENN